MSVAKRTITSRCEAEGVAMRAATSRSEADGLDAAWYARRTGRLGCLRCLRFHFPTTTVPPHRRRAHRSIPLPPLTPPRPPPPAAPLPSPPPDPFSYYSSSPVSSRDPTHRYHPQRAEGPKEKKASGGGASSHSPTTTLSHVVFGVASSRRTLPLPLRLPLLRLWLRPPARAFLFLDGPPRASASLPPNLHLRVSSPDASRFPYTHPRGLPSAVRVARIARELLLELHSSHEQHQRHSSSPRWLVLCDDDTAFVLPNLLHTLSKYDWREPWYLGARSESAAQNAWHGFSMAYGGGGIAVSWPLAARLAHVLDSCLLRYPHLYGSDARIYACLAELGVELTHEPGFHQVDLHGDISGLLRAHPLAPLVSLHHLDHVYPLYPDMDRTKAVEHFFRAADADPARILQQTVCYDHSRSLTVSVAWGYSVQVFKGNVLLPELLAVQKTFVPWKRGRNVTDVFLFDTKHYPRDECKSATLFFMRSVSSGEGKTESNYSRQLPGKCLPNLISLRDLQQIKVTSELLHLIPGKALRRHCCDIVLPSSQITMDINIRKCKDDELIAMHS